MDLFVYYVKNTKTLAHIYDLFWCYPLCTMVDAFSKRGKTLEKKILTDEKK